tara:strand:+ start:9426 stop:9773 length:348 start_codon:yes stop_codon:yes gene_type:complete
MSNRNDFRDKVVSDSSLREKIFDRKFIESVTQYSRMKTNAPTSEQLKKDLTHVQKIFTMGDKMYKYAYEYYGDTNHWWVIAWYNNKPTDSHFNLGDTVYIPFPLDVAINIATREE